MTTRLTTQHYDISAVSMALAETMAEHMHDDEWKGRYQYEDFGGFPGFWTYGADAGAVFHAATAPAFLNGELSDWIDLVDSYADSIIRFTQANERPPADPELREILARLLQEQNQQA